LDLIREIHSYLSSDIQSMNNIIVESLSVDEELIGVISNHLSSAGGKRIRPVLTMLSAKMFGYSGEKAIRLAAAVEFIHMATLLHDDVIDGSKMRRFLPTANVLWGSKASILVGDFLFSQSFKLIVSTRSFSALEVLSRASAIIAEGEVSQLSQLESKEMISEQDYIKIINAKTAELFGAACGVGAIVADRESDLEHIREFGLRLGNIFQISDDALDYFSESEKVGKNIGDDFYEGKVTLPLIFLLKKLEKKQKYNLKEIFFADKRSKSDFAHVRNLMFEHDISSDIDNYLARLGEKTRSALSSIKIADNSQSKKYLQKLVDFAINRSY
jgi:octaprenyl-diphosphate synthase